MQIKITQLTFNRLSKLVRRGSAPLRLKYFLLVDLIKDIQAPMRAKMFYSYGVGAVLATKIPRFHYALRINAVNVIPSFREAFLQADF
jgi:hypothetical protein